MRFRAPPDSGVRRMKVLQQPCNSIGVRFSKRASHRFWQRNRGRSAPSVAVLFFLALSGTFFSPQSAFAYQNTCRTAVAQSLPLSKLEKMAASLLNAKKPREALPCLEHLVSARPDEKRYRMGLTVALEAIGENDRARHHLEKLRGAKLAAKERDVVNQRLQALSQAKTWSGYLRFGITPETNLGKVAGTQEIVINGIPFTYHPTQKAEPKVRLHIETGLEYLPHLNRDTRLRLALSLDSKISDDKTYRDNRVQLDLGLRHYGDRQRQAEFGLRLAIRTLADKTYSDQTGLYAQFSQQISRKGTFRAKLETYRLAHESFTAADGRRNLAALSYNHMVSPQLRLSLSGFLEQTNANWAQESGHRASLTLGATYAFKGGIVSSLSVTKGRENRKGAHHIFGVKRRDDSLRIDASLFHRDWRIGPFVPVIKLGVEQSNSNIPIARFDNQYISFGFSRSF